MKRYNEYLKRYIEKNEGEIFCPKCNGKGKIKSKTSYFKMIILFTCDKCLGSGKIDWVETIMGKNK